MLKVEVFEYSQDEAPEISLIKGVARKGSKVTPQDQFFKKGSLLKKVSNNVYFNFGEILECVGTLDGVAYFTCERLKSIHLERVAEGSEKMPGIPLREGEVFEQVCEKSLRIEALQKSVASERYMISSLEDELADLADKMNRLQKRIAAKEKQREELKIKRQEKLNIILLLKNELAEEV